MFSWWGRLGEIDMFSVPNIWHNVAEESEVSGTPQRKLKWAALLQYGESHFFLQYKLIPWRKLKRLAGTWLKPRLCMLWVL